MKPAAEALSARRKWCRMLLTREIKRFEKTSGAAGTSPTPERNALWLKQIGDSINAAAGSLPQGAKEISLVNIHTGISETVSLNPKCSAEKNAKLYHRKALKAEQAENRQSGTLSNIANDINVLRDALRHLDDAFAARDENLLSEAISQGVAALESTVPGVTGQATATTNIVTPPYRFVSVAGWNIYIGKTDEQNDELSLKFAAPTDIWFHVAGHAGSHVIIQRPKGAPEPPQTVITAAAALSAWYSKQRRAPLAEVHFTTARHVRKRRGAPAGEVVVELWKTLKTAPRSPESFA
jgi:predicted ribosome quality control (RQC) complex YloA/Tae2 family protein